MIKKIAILGSTGSIGTQGLDVARNLGIEVVGLSTNSKIELLIEQIIEFRPKIVSVGTEEIANELNLKLKELNIETDINYGIEGLIKVATIDEVELVLTSVVGSVGLVPTIHAIKAKKNIALANKETLVTAGQIVMEEAKKNDVKIIPVDSEHSAIFQCLEGGKREDVSKFILTASGGPFRGKKINELKNVTVEEALKHPNWTMGSKITIDSATMMNKGLEVIEAKWLFSAEADIIDVVVHPQSIIHSMVEYNDGSVIAQLGTPDMRIPIQYSITYPKRYKNDFGKLNLIKNNNLTFEEPDFETFKCLRLAFESLREGGLKPCILNAANEVAVSMFLNKRIGFTQIGDIIEDKLNSIANISEPSIEEIIEMDKTIRASLSKKY